MEGYKGGYYVSIQRNPNGGHIDASHPDIQAILDLQKKRGVDLHLTREQQDEKGSGTAEGAESGANEAGRSSDSAGVTPQPKTTATVTTTARALPAGGGDNPDAGSKVATAMGVTTVSFPGPWKATCGWKEGDCDSDDDEDTSSEAKVSSAL